MKNYIILLLALMIGTSITAQNLKPHHNFDAARKYFKTIEDSLVYIEYEEDSLGVEVPVEKRKLMSQQGLNIFLAKKVNAYLSGSGDLSLYKGYAIVDPSDGKLFIGYNFAKDPGDKRTKWVHTVGLKANVTDLFSTIFSNAGDKKIQEGVGASYKATYLFRGSIWYDKAYQKLPKAELQKYFNINKETTKITQADVLNFERARFKNTVNALMEKDSLEYVNSLKGVDLTSPYKEKLDTTFYKKKNDEYKEKYITLESDFVDEEENYNKYHAQWLSFNVFIPFQSIEYKVAKDFKDNIQTKSLYGFDGMATWSNLIEYHKVKWFVNLTGGIKNLNNITTEQIDKYSFNDYKIRAAEDSTMVNLTQIKTTDVYVGSYVSEPTAYFSAQFVSLFLYSKKAGLSAKIEQYTGNYHPMNVTVGLPFAFKGKDEETKANFELQLKFNDVTNNAIPDKSIDEKYTIGISVGIPLTSKIY